MNAASYSPWSSLFSLAVVLGLILAIAWLLKRSKLRLMNNPVPMKVIGGLSLGTRERVIVVEIGEQWHVLGVTAQSITPITQLPKQALPEVSANAVPNFLTTLQARLGK